MSPESAPGPADEPLFVTSGDIPPDLYAREGDPYEPEERRRSLADPRRYTMEEVLKMLSLE